MLNTHHFTGDLSDIHPVRPACKNRGIDVHTNCEAGQICQCKSCHSFFLHSLPHRVLLVKPALQLGLLTFSFLLPDNFRQSAHLYFKQPT
jgi:hypothetical protein